jgi:heat shock protein HtpX
MKRIFLFLLTNIAIMLVISIVISVFGLGQILDQNGVHIDLMSLLDAVCGSGYDGFIYFPRHV